jgi:DNA polymerase (family 10)
MARDIGVLVSVASDAHSTLELGHLQWGIGQARRGWLEARDVLNTRPVDEVRRLLAATMGHRAAPAPVPSDPPAGVDGACRLNAGAQ